MHTKHLAEILTNNRNLSNTNYDYYIEDIKDRMYKQFSEGIGIYVLYVTCVSVCTCVYVCVWGGALHLCMYVCDCVYVHKYVYIYICASV